ncbi:DSBA-like thioredoxin domain protein (plasmid) [Caballeronia sp. SBC1]|uniref:DsbA family oxidoreductase n=1 Tax=unclassified Caballeronia TaxID=2646786 RepID=UPI0013E136F8|nr:MULTISPECIES: DsbA family oxidoreductase [unclassified Caballeronia]QIE26547.1 DSBA-like thioredoxin domain protein [Caballeronia sp. SBC2]QIN64137.1 DSBA-like thioredoxin domain protein [Caballeronia sp. SBC1]
MQALEISVNYDFICPWCWIGHLNLASGIRAANLPAPASIRYVPFELNPTMPVDGMDRREYRTAKFGSWMRSQVLDAQVAATGLAAGAQFNYEKVSRTPNTRLAHQLMQYAMSIGDTHKTEALYQSIFAAYFSQGRDIGLLGTLVEIAAKNGFDGVAAEDYLTHGRGLAKVREAQRLARQQGIRSVPTVFIAGEAISGAQPPAVFANALRAGLERSVA